MNNFLSVINNSSDLISRNLLSLPSPSQQTVDKMYEVGFKTLCALGLIAGGGCAVAYVADHANLDLEINGMLKAKITPNNNKK